MEPVELLMTPLPVETPVIYHPDDVPTWQPPTLRKGELLWLDQARRHDDDVRPSRSLPGRMRRAVDRWSIEAGWVAAGLEAATATIPPPQRPGGVRRGTAISDPTASVIHATLDTAGRAAGAWAHLTGRCLLDGIPDDDGMAHACPGGGVDELAAMLGIDLDHEGVVDELAGTPPGTAAFARSVSAAASWHSQAAATCLAAWLELYRDGAEPSLLETWATFTERLASRTASLAGSLAGWSGRRERACQRCGGGLKAGERTCGACRTEKWRDSLEQGPNQ